MNAEKEPSENVPMVQINTQNTLQEINENKTNGSNETAPPSPTPSQKSISVTEKEKRSQKVTIDISGDTPLVKKTVTHVESLNLLNADINSLLPGPMQIQLAEDTTNGDNIKNSNSAAKKEGASKDAPDGFNQYRNQKSFSQGMLDIALFTSNVNQLRAVTKNPPEPITFNFCFVIFLLVCSVVFQIAVGLILLLSARYNVNKQEERRIVYTMGNYVVAGIFLITVLNLFIAVFYDYDNPVYNNNNNTNH